MDDINTIKISKDKVIEIFKQLIKQIKIESSKNNNFLFNQHLNRNTQF